MFNDKVVVTIDVDDRRIFTRLYSETEAFDVVQKVFYRVEEWFGDSAVERVTIGLTALHTAKEG